ncbi:RDD family protein [Candidatus Woesearchaeota archaeon]|nr:RDD family protein [Candidatus Woesearchaeota archaeon]
MKLDIPKERTFSATASLPKRIMAFLADMLIIATIMVPFGKILEGAMPKGLSIIEASMRLSSDYSGGLILMYFSISALAFLYFYLMESNMGQSIGKKIFSMHIVSDNGQLKGWQVAVRNLFLVPLFPFDLLVIVDPAFMLFTKTNQRLSEILSRTRVVQTYSLDLYGSNLPV